jgi:hypothetical protein
VNNSAAIRMFYSYSEAILYIKDEAISRQSNEKKKNIVLCHFSNALYKPDCLTDSSKTDVVGKIIMFF